MFSLICAWTNGTANNREVVDLRRRRTHYDVAVMFLIDGYDAHDFPVYIGDICGSFKLHLLLYDKNWCIE